MTDNLLCNTVVLSLMAREIPIKKLHDILDEYDVIQRELSENVIDCRTLFEDSPLIYTSKEFKQVQMYLQQMEEIETKANKLTMRMYEHLEWLENFATAPAEQWESVPRAKYVKMKASAADQLKWFYSAAKQFRDLLPEFDKYYTHLKDYLTNIVYETGD